MQIMMKNSSFDRSVAEDMISTTIRELIVNKFITEKEWEIDLVPLKGSSFNLVRYLQRSYEKFRGEEIPEYFFTTDETLLLSRFYLEKRFGIKLINLQEYLHKEANITLGDENGEKGN